jgi:hypothetical protein
LGLWLLHYYFFKKVLDGGGWVIVKAGCLAVCYCNKFQHDYYETLAFIQKIAEK